MHLIPRLLLSSTPAQERFLGTQEVMGALGPTLDEFEEAELYRGRKLGLGESPSPFFSCLHLQNPLWCPCGCCG